MRIKKKYKASYAFDLKADEQTQKIIIAREKLVYWQRGSAWKKERDIEFENPSCILWSGTQIFIYILLSIPDQMGCYKGFPFMVSRCFSNGLFLFSPVGNHKSICSCQSNVTSILSKVADDTILFLAMSLVIRCRQMKRTIHSPTEGDWMTS